MREFNIEKNKFNPKIFLLLLFVLVFSFGAKNASAASSQTPTISASSTEATKDDTVTITATGSCSASSWKLRVNPNINNPSSLQDKSQNCSSGSCQLSPTYTLNSVGTYGFYSTGCNEFTSNDTVWIKVKDKPTEKKPTISVSATQITKDDAVTINASGSCSASSWKLKVNPNSNNPSSLQESSKDCSTGSCQWSPKYTLGSVGTYGFYSVGCSDLKSDVVYVEVKEAPLEVPKPAVSVSSEIVTCVKNTTCDNVKINYSVTTKKALNLSLQWQKNSSMDDNDWETVVDTEKNCPDSGEEILCSNSYDFKTNEYGYGTYWFRSYAKIDDKSNQSSTKSVKVQEPKDYKPSGKISVLPTPNKNIIDCREGCSSPQIKVDATDDNGVKNIKLYSYGDNSYGDKYDFSFDCNNQKSCSNTFDLKNLGEGKRTFMLCVYDSINQSVCEEQTSFWFVKLDLALEMKVEYKSALKQDESTDVKITAKAENVPLKHITIMKKDGEEVGGDVARTECSGSGESECSLTWPFSSKETGYFEYTAWTVDQLDNSYSENIGFVVCASADSGCYEFYKILVDNKIGAETIKNIMGIRELTNAPYKDVIAAVNNRRKDVTDIETAVVSYAILYDAIYGGKKLLRVDGALDYANLLANNVLSYVTNGRIGIKNETFNDTTAGVYCGSANCCNPIDVLVIDNRVKPKMYDNKNEWGIVIHEFVHAYQDAVKKATLWGEDEDEAYTVDSEYDLRREDIIIDQFGGSSIYNYRLNLNKAVAVNSITNNEVKANMLNEFYKNKVVLEKVQQNIAKGKNNLNNVDVIYPGDSYNFALLSKEDAKAYSDVLKKSFDESAQTFQRKLYYRPGQEKKNSERCPNDGIK
jgi:hypothetical protein